MALTSPSSRCTIMLTTYNEAGAIPFVFDELREAIDGLQERGIGSNVLVVDDRSPDGTAAIALVHAQRLGLDASILSGERLGLGAAVQRGFAHGLRSRPDFFVTLDADGQHDARQIPVLVDAFLARRVDMLLGSRFAPGADTPALSAGRAAVGRGGNAMFRWTTGTQRLKDSTTAFRVLRAEVAQLFGGVASAVNGPAAFGAFVASAQAHGFTIAEAPILYRPRHSGVSKPRLSDCAAFATDLFRVRQMSKAIRAAHAAELHGRLGRTGMNPATGLSGLAYTR